MSSATSVTALAALSLSAVACSGSESSAETTLSTPTTVADAVEKTLAAGTAKMTLTMEHTRSGGFGADIGERDTIEGVVDFDERRVELTTDVDEFVLDETAFYWRGEGEGEWRRYARDPGSGDEIFPDVTLGRLDPIPVLEYATSIDSTFGPGLLGKVDGEITRRFSGQGEAAGLMRALLPDSLYQNLQWETHGASVDPSAGVPFDVWVGEDGRVSKVELDFPDFDSFVGDLTTVELSDLGVEVDIELPPPSETVDA